MIDANSKLYRHFLGNGKDQQQIFRMKQTLAVDSLSEFSGDTTNTTTTLTPTTLKIFETEEYCFKDLLQFEDNSGFVPPLPLPPVSSTKSSIKRSYFNLTGGTTTVVAQKSAPPPVQETISVEHENASDYSNDSDSSDYQPQPKMLKRFNSKTNKKENRSGNKRKGNRKDDYEGLPPAERQRLVQKRERNKQAAARCRQRKMDLTNTLLEEVQMWVGKKEQLEEVIRQLRGQKEELEFVLQAHKAVCRLGGFNNTSVPVSVPVALTPVKREETEQDEYAYILQEQPMKRQRPLTLSISLSSRHTGVDIETPSTIIPCFENFMTPNSDMTPMHVTTACQAVESLNTPIVHSMSLSTPSETVNLISL